MASLTDHILDGDIQIECPHCKAPLTITMRMVTKEDTITCTSCGNKTKLTNADKKASDAITKSTKGLDDAINKLSRRFGR